MATSLFWTIGVVSGRVGEHLGYFGQFEKAAQARAIINKMGGILTHTILPYDQHFELKVGRKLFTLFITSGFVPGSIEDLPGAISKEAESITSKRFKLNMEKGRKLRQKVHEQLEPLVRGSSKTDRILLD